MGYLHYGVREDAFHFDDWQLSHLKIVIAAKLRRGESFLFSWVDETTNATQSLWLNPSIPLHFEFEKVEEKALNRAWAEALSISANSGGGLTLLPEPADPAKQPTN